MFTIRNGMRIIALLAFTLALSAAAQAQLSRTWVSGLGDDNNPCSRTAPCKTFAGAISKTNDKGEIDALDPGGFGSVLITKSITIDGAGTMASILNSLTYGVLINDSSTGAPNSIVVTLRNLSMDGTDTGTYGINFVSGKTVNVENCRIFGNNSAAPSGIGIRVLLSASGSNLNVKNTNIFNNRVGISATTSASPGNFTMNVNDCHIENNASDGIFLDSNAYATVRNSNLSFNGGAGLSLDAAAINSATVIGSEINHNLYGIYVGKGTTVRLGDSTVVQNSTNFSNSGSIVSYCNNHTDSPSIPGPGSVTTPCLK